MSKTIHATLLAHKAQSSTTLTDLLLVGPLPDDTYRGFTLLDQDVTYDDGNGAVTYKARTGFEVSAIQSSADLSVDNAEANSLPPLAGFEVEGFTQAEIDAGVLDKTPFVIYRVNYNDLTSGRHEIRHGGTMGEIGRKVGNLWVMELRSLSQQAKQQIGEVDSLSCRAIEGSMPIGTGGGAIEERHPCEFNFDALYVAGTVTSVGAEADLQFTDSSLAQAADYFAPGKTRWLTGDNAGQVLEVDTFALGGGVTLRFPTVNPIQVGDTFEIRPSCSKLKDGHNGCQTFWLTAWVLHFRGEPYIPVGETAKLNSPGAAIGGSPNGTGEAL